MNLAEVGNHLWQSTVVALIAWLLIQTIRQNSARIRYSIWMLASVKFLIPLSMLVALGSHISWPVPSLRTAVPSPVIQFIGQPFQPVSIIQQEPLSTIEIAPMSQPRQSVMPRILWTIWLVGVVAVTGGWFVRLWRVRGILRTAQLLKDGPEIEALHRVSARPGANRRIRCATTKSVIEPGVHGAWRPILLLPARITERLNADQLDTIIEHEICHIRCHDNLLAMIHMTVEAVFWFHPLVWWLGKKLLDERERACDEHVLANGSDPKVYASAILKVCEFYVASPVPYVAGVTGSNLENRVVEIMKNQRRLRLNFARKALIGAAATLAIGVPILIGATQATDARSYSKPTLPVQGSALAPLQIGNPSIVFQSRAYQRIGASRGKWWEIRLPDHAKVELADEEGARKRLSCSASSQIIPRFGKTLTATSPHGQRAEVQIDSDMIHIEQNGGTEISLPLPTHGQIVKHWNYATSLAWSPDEKFILVGSEAGSSDSHFEDYWLLKVADQTWQYAGGGNDAIWSPDSAWIAWTTPRDLASLGKINVWVVHVVFLDMETMKIQTVTSGTTYESDLFWCRN